MSARHVGRTDISAIGIAAEETEVERAANRQLLQEGRLLRSKELERLRNEEENGYDGPRGASNGNSRFSSQRSSVELSSSVSSFARTADARDLRMQLNQLEDKFKGAMMVNAQLDNDTQVLRYEVDLLKDKLDDMVELNSSLQKSYVEKKRDLAYHRLQITELTNRLEFARKQIEARDELIQQHNLILLDANEMNDLAPPTAKLDTTGSENNLPIDKKRPGKQVTNGHSDHSSKPLVNGLPDENGPCIPSMALITKTTAELLRTLPETTLDSQINRLFKERSDLLARVERLESELEEQRKVPETTGRFSSRSRLSTSDQADLKQDIQNLRSQAQEYKYKLQEALQKNASLESDIVRLEGQIKRYKTIADSCEQQEADLKQDRRKFQRELREVQSQLEDYKSENARLQRKLDKALRNPNNATGSGMSSLRSTRESSSQR
ncbi:Leucine-rich repeat flightless-interacting protein 2 [Clonorchis sinensis]|uniref:Leucine-rich repeat flightless-interacting protein 2 n=2 Tax=Opisthorchiidae TaxID=6196 RepID=A0A8T1MIE5_CLOSI|nr:Leucine-rich repeat flightless-interacting protein 2 [Clonorchis sinensis]